MFLLMPLVFALLLLLLLEPFFGAGTIIVATLFAMGCCAVVGNCFCCSCPYIFAAAIVFADITIAFAAVVGVFADIDLVLALLLPFFWHFSGIVCGTAVAVVVFTDIVIVVCIVARFERCHYHCNNKKLIEPHYLIK